MIGPVQVTGPGTPNRLRENQNENEEEQADYFEEDDVSHSAERLEKTAHASGEASSGVPSSAPGRSACATWGNAFNRHRPGYCAGRRGAHDVLPGHASHQAHPDSQHPADGLRFHTRL